MGIKLLSNYPLRQFPGIAIPNVELTFKGEFRQEKRDDKYYLYATCYFYNNPEHENPFEITPYTLVSDVCPSEPLTAIYTAFKEERLQGMETQDN